VLLKTGKESNNRVEMVIAFTAAGLSFSFALLILFLSFVGS
jgi:hypothetical protein